MRGLRATFFFKLFNPTTLYCVPESRRVEFEKEIEGMKKKSDPLPYERSLIKEYNILKESGYLYKPNIHIITKDSVKIIYLSENQFQKVRNFKMKDLQQAGKKVIIELDLNDKFAAYYYSDSIVSIKVVDGNTKMRK